MHLAVAKALLLRNERHQEHTAWLVPMLIRVAEMCLSFKSMLKSDVHLLSAALFFNLLLTDCMCLCLMQVVQARL